MDVVSSDLDEDDVGPIGEASCLGRYRPLASVACAASAGVAADWSLQENDWRLWPWWAIGALACAGASRLGRLRRWSLAGWLTLGCVACVGGGWRHLHANYFSVHDLAHFARLDPAPVCLEGVLCDVPVVTPAEDPNPLRVTPLGPITEATLEPTAIRDGDVWRPCAGRARLRVAGVLTDLRAGDHVQLFAKFGRPPPPLNPHQFDWRAVERSRRRLTEVYCSSIECVTVLESRRRWPARWIGDLRSWCRAQLARCVGPEQTPLALAVVLGAREQLDDSSLQAFFHTGTIHLLVVSGMHVGMLAGLAWSIARLVGLGQRQRTMATASVVLLFVFITGPHPSVIRSTLLVLSLLAAMATGRQASRLNLLAGGALAVVAYNPDELFRTGTQLSFLSAAALLAMTRMTSRRRPRDPLQRLLDASRPWPVRAVRWCLRGCLAATFASLVVWLVTLPLVGAQFHIATPVGIAMTPLVWPFVGVALAAGLGALSIGWLFPPLDLALGWVVALSLQCVEQAIVVAEDLPGGRLYGPGPPSWWLAGLYAGVTCAGFAADAGRRRRLRWLCAAATAWIALGGLLVWGPPTDRSELTCTFLSMGHGVATVIELPQGETLLYDCGSLGSPTWAARTIAEFLWGRGIGRIDMVLLSHADIDHFNGLPGLADMFRIESVAITPQMAAQRDAGQTPALDFLFGALDRRRIPIRTLAAGDKLSWEEQGVALEILHPTNDGGSESDNASSMVATIEYAGRRIVLPGDLEAPGIDQVSNGPRLDCDVLLAPHHGSVHSDPSGFAAWCTPEWTIVSGRRRSAAQPLLDNYSGTGRAVWNTAERGAIEIQISSAGVRAKSFVHGEALQESP